MIISCPKCGVQMQIGPKHAGKTLRCPKCQSQFQSPAPEHVKTSEDPLDQLAAASTTPARSSTRRPATRYTAARHKSKAPLVIGIIAAVVVLGVIGAIFSGVGDTSPETASWEDLVRAYYGNNDRMVKKHFPRLLRDDPLRFRQNIDALRDEIEASGLSCEEYGKRKRQVAEYSRSLDQKKAREEKAIKSKYESRIETLSQRSRALDKKGYEAVQKTDRRFGGAAWGSQEYKQKEQQMKLDNELFKKAKAARDEEDSLSKEMYRKLKVLNENYSEMLRAYKENLGWRPHRW